MLDNQIISFNIDAAGVEEQAKAASEAMDGLRQSAESLRRALLKAAPEAQMVQGTARMEQAASSLSGQLFLLQMNFGKLKAAAVRASAPVAQALLPALNQGVQGATRFVKAAGAVIGALLGGAEGTQALTGSTEAASAAQKTLTKTASAAGKAVKRALAGFDELQILKFPSSGGSASSAETEDITLPTVSDPLSPQLQAIVDKINALLAPLREIDLTPLIQAFARLKAALEPVTKSLFAGLEWAWFNLLVPMAKWTAEDALPAFLDVLSGALAVFHSVLEALKPLGQWLWERFLQPIAAWTGDAIVSALGYLSAGLNALSDWILSGVPAVEGLIRTMDGFGETMGKLWQGISAAASQAWNAVSEAWQAAGSWLEETVTAPAGALFGGLWTSVTQAASACWEGVKGLFSPAADWFSGLFGRIWETVSGVFSNTGAVASGSYETVKAAWIAAGDWFRETVTGPVSGCFGEMWSNLQAKAAQTWAGVQTVFSAAGDFFRDTFQSAWEQVVGVFSVAGSIFVDIQNGILNAFRAIVNQLIAGLNQVVSVPFQGINAALSRIRNVQILGMSPFSGIRSVSVPRIPYLAQGAVLPANKPFLAVVGDQPSGTNVEAPLTTIQAAVLQALSPGQREQTALLRQLLQAVLGIEIGDAVIGQAAARYQQKMAVVTGGI